MKLFLKNNIKHCLFRSFTNNNIVKYKKTILYDIHKEYNAIFKIYNDYLIPDEYENDTLITTHLHTRSNCSLFDFTYRPILKIIGKDKINFLEKFIGSDIKNLWENECRISLLLNDKGGIIDELLIILRKNDILIYFNIQCKNKVLNFFKKELENFNKMDVKIEEYNSHKSLIIQGSKSINILNELIENNDLNNISFMSGDYVNFNNTNIFLTRYSCTGEDGFDILIPNEQVINIFKLIKKNPLVKLAGLSVLNTLRLECGFCIYGKDINENITPIESNFKWTLGKRRLKELNFNGANIIDNQIKNGTKIKRIGLIIQNSNIPPKEMSKIYSTKTNQNIYLNNLKQIGYITSSIFSPLLQKPIAMGYINSEESFLNNNVNVNIMGKMELAQVTKIPFVPLSVHKM